MGEVQVETRAPSSERQVWHHGAAAPLNEQFTHFSISAISKAMIYGASPGIRRRDRGVGRVAGKAARQVLDEGGGESERRRRRGARKRGKQRRGGGGEVRSFVAVHHARVEEMGRGGAGPR